MLEHKRKAWALETQYLGEWLRSEPYPTFNEAAEAARDWLAVCARNDASPAVRIVPVD